MERLRILYEFFYELDPWEQDDSMLPGTLEYMVKHDINDIESLRRAMIDE